MPWLAPAAIGLEPATAMSTWPEAMALITFAPLSNFTQRMS